MKRFALIVGIDNYHDSQIQNLECAENDCTKLAGFLEYAAKYDAVKALHGPNVTSERILDTASEMVGRLDDDDLFLFFFSGHGTEHNGKHLLLCPNVKYSRLKSTHQTVPINLLKEETDRKKLNRVFILDACRSNLLSARAANPEGLKGEQILRDIVARPSTSRQNSGSLAVLCSCEENSQAAEIPECGQGLFSAAFLDVLNSGVQASADIALTDSLESDIAEKMYQLARKHGLPQNQRPWIQRSGPPPVILGKRVVDKSTITKVFPTNISDQNIEIPAKPFSLETTTKEWFYIYLEYKENLANRVSDNKVLYIGKIIYDINGAELIRKGLAKDVTFRNGELLVTVELLPLIINARWNDIACCLEQEDKPDIDDPLYLFCVKKDVKATLNFINNSDSSLKNIVLLCIGLAQKEKAHNMLNNFSSSNYDYNLLSIAKLWFFLFNNKDKAQKLIEEAENKADYSSYWCRCAESWKEIFNDTTRSRQCLKNAENKADDSSDWSCCAESWKEIFNDTTRSRKCLENAENKADYSSDWCRCAESWKEIFKDTTRSRKCLEKAENKSDDSSDWSCCVNGWRIIFNDTVRTRQCLENAENKAEGSSDWIHCAEDWKRIFNDTIRTRQCLEKAENYTEFPIDLLNVAYTWKSLLNDANRTRQCLEKAENYTEFPSDLHFVASYWKRLLNDTKRARQCLENADNNTESSFGWTNSAEKWKEIFNDTTRARQCLEKAENIAKFSSDWVFCAEKWKKIFNDTKRAQQCLTNAEHIAKTSTDWSCCANYWERIFNNTICARQCLEKSEKCAKDFIDWSLCLNVWKLLNEPDRAEKCRKKAELLK